MGSSVVLQWVVERVLMRDGVGGTCVDAEWDETGRKRSCRFSYLGGAEYERVSAFVRHAACTHAPYVVAV